MKRSPTPTRVLALASALAAAAALASCASAPKPAPVEPEAEAVSAASESAEEAPAELAAPQKVAKERILIVKVPVLVKESSFYPDGLLDEYAVYKYDESKTRLLEKATFDGSRPDPVERLVSEWKDGRLASDTAYDAEGRVRLRREYGYDQAGRLVSERASDAKGQPLSSSTYAYDGQGRRIEWRAFDGAGLLKAITTYGYAPARIDMKDAAGKPTGSILTELLADGRPAKRIYLAADGATQRTEAYEYVAAGPSSLEVRRPDGGVVTRTTYAYGASGELLSSSTSDGSGAVRETRSYEYAIREDSKTEIYYE